MSKTVDARLQSLFDDPDKTMQDICAYVSHGGTLTELCELWDLPYGRIIHWIRVDKERSSLLNDAQNDRAEWFKEKIFSEFKRIGTSDIRKLYNEDGGLKPVHEWPDDVASFVQSVEVNELWEGRGKDREVVGEVKKVKMWNKEKALEMIGKNINMFIERVEHTGKITLEDLINQSREDSDGE